MGILLENEEDLRFSEHMVKTLNTILLTTSELFSLRTSLKQLDTEVSRSSRTVSRDRRPSRVRQLECIIVIGIISETFFSREESCSFACTEFGVIIRWR